MRAEVGPKEPNAELIEQFVSSLPVLSPRRVKEYWFNFAKTSRDLGPLPEDDVHGLQRISFLGAKIER